MKKSVEILCNVVIAIVIIAIVAVCVNGSIKNVFSQHNDKPIYRGNENINNVSLMINVYWGTEYVVPMLDCLDEYNAKATFFVGGSWAVSNMDIVYEILYRGHELGNHGYFHKNQGSLTYQQNYDEINNNHQVIVNNTSYEMQLFAPPSGDYGDNTLKSATVLGYKTIMWSRDTIDWRDKDSQLVYTRATKNISNGELILMHPTKHTLSALPKILQNYKENNFVATTVSCNINGVMNEKLQNIPEWIKTSHTQNASNVHRQLWRVC